MKKYIMLMVSAVVFAFASCTDGEEINIKYQVDLGVRVDRLMSSFRSPSNEDFKMDETHSIRIHTFIYNEEGNLETSFLNFVNDYSVESKFSIALNEGKYTAITIADFVQGKSSPRSEEDITSYNWSISNTEHLNDLIINSSDKIDGWFYEVLGATKTDLIVSDSKMANEIIVKPITCLIYFKVDYFKNGSSIKAESLDIVGERINNISQWNGEDWSFDSSFNINNITRLINIKPLQSMENNYSAFHGYRAFMPTKKMRFWFQLEAISNDGKMVYIDSSDKYNGYTSFNYTDVYDLEAGKQYLIYMLLPDLSMTLSPFSSTSKGGNITKNDSYNVNSLDSYRVMEILK